MRIASTDNKIVKSVARLAAKKERDETGTYVIEGPNLTAEALKSGARLLTVLVSDRFDREATDLLSQIPQSILYEVTDTVFSRLSDTETPQGILAVVEKKETDPSHMFAKGTDLLVLDRVQDPGNLGTMIRTAEAAGFAGILLLKGSGDIYAPKTVRAAAGSLFRMPFLFAEHEREAAELLKKNGKRIVCTAPGADTVYMDADLKEDVAIVIGNEGNGVSKEFLSLADLTVGLPMEGPVESLNAAAAAAILLYETVRQRRNVR